MLKSTFGLAAVNHQYTEEERQVLNSYQSLEYLPPHSKVYRNWLQQQPARLDWDRWLMMGLIGFSVGILGFLLHQIIDLISEVRTQQCSTNSTYIEPSLSGNRTGGNLALMGHFKKSSWEELFYYCKILFGQIRNVWISRKISSS